MFASIQTSPTTTLYIYGATKNLANSELILLYKRREHKYTPEYIIKPSSPANAKNSKYSLNNVRHAEIIHKYEKISPQPHLPPPVLCYFYLHCVRKDFSALLRVYYDKVKTIALELRFFGKRKEVKRFRLKLVVVVVEYEKHFPSYSS